MLPKWYNDLSTRAANICCNAGIVRKNQLKKAILSGSLKSEKNCGKKVFIECAEYLGLDGSSLWLSQKYSKRSIDRAIKILKSVGML